MTLTPDQQAEIDALRAAPRQTLRAVSEGMEAHLYNAIPVFGSRVCTCGRLYG